MAPRVVPFLDLKRRHAALAGPIEDALLRVARSGQYVLGPAVAELETAFARRLGGGYGVGVASGNSNSGGLSSGGGVGSGSGGGVG